MGPQPGEVLRPIVETVDGSGLFHGDASRTSSAATNAASKRDLIDVHRLKTAAARQFFREYSGLVLPGPAFFYAM
jgi:hypothetical protein